MKIHTAMWFVIILIFATVSNWLIATFQHEATTIVNIAFAGTLIAILAIGVYVYNKFQKNFKGWD